MMTNNVSLTASKNHLEEKSLGFSTKQIPNCSGRTALSMGATILRAGVANVIKRRK